MLVTIRTSRASRPESSATDPTLQLFFEGRNAYIEFFFLIHTELVLLCQQ